MSRDAPKMDRTPALGNNCMTPLGNKSLNIGLSRDLVSCREIVALTGMVFNKMQKSEFLLLCGNNKSQHDCPVGK